MTNIQFADPLKLPKIIVTPKGDDLEITIQPQYQTNKNTGPKFAVVSTLVGYPFIITREAQNVVKQIDKNFYDLAKSPRPDIVIAMAFELCERSYRMRPVIAMIFDNGEPTITLDNHLYAIPQNVILEDRLSSRISPYKIWALLVKQSGSNHIEQIRTLINRAVRELFDPNQPPWSFADATADIYE